MPELLRVLAERKGLSRDGVEEISYADFKDRQFDRLADMLRQYMDLDRIREMLGSDR